MSGADRAVSFVAGVSYGPFRLQSALMDVVQMLRQQASTFGVVEVEYPHEQDGDGAPTLFLPKYQIRLFFDGISQRLRSVVVVSLATAGDIFYQGRVFCSHHFPATFSHVYDVLGPTFRGEVTPDDFYVLQYPGMKVSFGIPHEYAHLFASEDAHPTTLPNGAAPLAAMLTIEAPQADKSVSPVPRFVQSGDRLTIRVGDGLQMLRSNEWLQFGSSPQDAVSLLGQPASVFVKKDKRMQLQVPSGLPSSSSAAAAPPRPQHDYFFNYPLLGLDLLFSSVTHGLTKIVVHTPYPLHQSYLQVHRCNFSCVLTQPFWQPSTVMDSKSNWNWLQGQYRGVLPKPLISSTGCLNGTVMRLYCLHGLVVNVLPDGTIPQIVFYQADPVSAVLNPNNAGGRVVEAASHARGPMAAALVAPPPVVLDPRQHSSSRSPRELVVGPTLSPSPEADPAGYHDAMDYTADAGDLLSVPPGDSPIPEDELQGDDQHQGHAASSEQQEQAQAHPDGWDDQTPVLGGESPPPEGVTEGGESPPPEEDEEGRRPSKKKKSKKKGNTAW